MNSASRRERLLAGLLGGLTAALVALTVGLVLVILARGLPQVGALLNQGGLGAAALGTIGLTLITALVAAPFGVATAITLSELGQTGRLARGLRFGLGTLAGVPGVVWGLFGLVVFVQGLALGPSLLAAGLTLGVFTLPSLTLACEQALRAVPEEEREAAFALGATRWEVITRNVLPRAAPGILSGVALGLSRAAGETAPLLLTGAVYSISGPVFGLSAPFMALPHHVYTLVTQHPDPAVGEPLAFAAAALLLLLSLLIGGLAAGLRARLRLGEGL